MKKIPFIVTLLLITAWGYTSWYWYTCNIKGLCDTNGPIQTQSIEEDQTQDIEVKEDINLEEINARELGTIEDDEPESEVGDVEELGEESSSPRLSADDVLGESYVPEANETSIDATTDSSTGSLLKEEDTATGSLLNEEETIEIGNEEEQDICSAPLVGPLSYSTENSVEEMRKLESFLQSTGYISSIDGIFGENDLEAVKQLQLDYKEEMLDPWGITEPTGYVGRTTVATINAIACNNN